MADADPGSGGPGPPAISSLKENFNQQQVWHIFIRAPPESLP